MIKRSLLVLLVLAFPLQVFAQNDFGLWVNSTKYKSTAETDMGVTVKVKFDQKIGYGISWNHFSGPNVSTEFAAHQLKGKAVASLHSVTPPLDVTEDVGTLKANEISAVMKWHFMPRSFITPYIGAGVAYFTGSQIRTIANADIGETADTFKFENKFGFVANAGVNFAITRGMSIGLDGKYTPYKAQDKNDPDPATNSVKLDPLTIALGIRFRM